MTRRAAQMKSLSRIDRVKMALAEIAAAEKRARGVIHAAYPAGEAISWAHGRHIQDGVIISNSNYRCGDRFHVRNTKTGKERWISFYDVQCAAELFAHT